MVCVIRWSCQKKTRSPDGAKRNPGLLPSMCCSRIALRFIRATGPPLSFRQPLETRQSLGDLMEGLLVDGEDRHLRGAKQSGIVERADFQNRRGQTRTTCGQMGAAFGAEFPRHRVLEIAAGKLLRRSLGVAEAVARHQQKHVWRAAGDILAFAAVALRLHHRLALGHIAHLSAIAPAFQFHGVLPAFSRLILAGGAALAMLFCFASNRALPSPAPVRRYPQKERGSNLRWSPSTVGALPGMCPNRSSGRDLARSRPGENSHVVSALGVLGDVETFALHLDAGPQ